MAHDVEDTRSILSYVSKFRGKRFWINLDWHSFSDPVKAELVTDIQILQAIGVELTLTMSPEIEDFLDWASDLEFKFIKVSEEELELSKVEKILHRNQSLIIQRKGEFLTTSSIEILKSVNVIKCISLEKSVPEGKKFYHMNSLKVTDDSLLMRAKHICQQGIGRVHLLSVDRSGTLLEELFSSEGNGIMIYSDEYRTIRPLREEDIVDLLGMIGTSVRGAQLVPRVYEEIEESLNSYAVMEVDNYMVGCIALYTYDNNWGEIACLHIKKKHMDNGYAVSLMNYMEQRAQTLGLSHIFALSNTAQSFFSNKMNYRPISLKKLPPLRYQKVLEQNRRSEAFLKAI